ncbi:MAG: DUF5357 family protein [Cyanobacteria bacterium P01_D01_bin.128]
MRDILLRLIKALKPVQFICWQTLFWLGAAGLGGTFLVQRLGVQIDSETLNIIISVSWLLATIGGGWGALIVLSPGDYYSWKTVLLLSLFSWGTSLLANAVDASRFTIFLLSTFSWIFLAIAAGWGCQEKNFNLLGMPLSPWVSGAIVCWFALMTWNPDANWVPALVVWPLVSAAIATVPNFVDWDMTFKRPPMARRQQLVLLVAFSLLLSGWLQFHFRVQQWLTNYPSLMADDFRHSEFVYVLPNQQMNLSKGVPLLSAAENGLSANLNDVPWPRVERWLLNLDEQIELLEQSAKDNISAVAEQRFWGLQAIPLAAGDGYDLRLRAVWTGPTSESNGYFIEKSCQIRPRQQAVAAPAVPRPGTVDGAEQPNLALFGGVECDLQTDSYWGVPSV